MEVNHFGVMGPNFGNLTSYDHFSAVQKEPDIIFVTIEINAGDEIGRVISFHALINSI